MTRLVVMLMLLVGCSAEIPRTQLPPKVMDFVFIVEWNPILQKAMVRQWDGPVYWGNELEGEYATVEDARQAIINIRRNFEERQRLKKRNQEIKDAWQVVDTVWIKKFEH